MRVRWVNGSLFVEAENTTEQNELAKLQQRQDLIVTFGQDLIVTFGFDYNGQELEGPARVIIKGK